MFKALFALAAFASFAFAGPAAAQTPVPRVVQVAADAYMVQGLSALGSSANRNFISNAAFVVTPEGVLVVDALGSPALA
ncbi:MAG TPA: MBL fold metallo-hydrolase, partial [Rubrivivax sp.]|nr:MBL fold metallo-hydrolase [Rubrivivax sp.]